MVNHKIIVNNLISTRAMSATLVIELSAVDQHMIDDFVQDLVKMRGYLDKVVDSIDLHRPKPSGAESE